MSTVGLHHRVSYRLQHIKPSAHIKPGAHFTCTQNLSARPLAPQRAHDPRLPTLVQLW